MNEKHFKKFTDLKALLGELHSKADSPHAHAVHDKAFEILKDHSQLFTEEQYQALAVPKSPEPGS